MGRRLWALLSGFGCVLACGGNSRSSDDSHGDAGKSLGGASGSAMLGGSGDTTGGSVFGGSGGRTTENGGTGGVASWTCTTLDDLCECSRGPSGADVACATDFRCCFAYHRANSGIIQEICECQNANEDQCQRAILEADPNTGIHRMLTCPP